MDFTNEPYVLFCTRDTTAWKLLGFEGQTVLLHVWRKLDATGSLGLGGLAPPDVVVLHTSVPEAVARVGLGACLLRGVLVLRDDALVAPDYVAIQAADRRAVRRRRAAVRAVSLALREVVFERDGWACQYCGADLRDVTGQVDHVVPVSRGGTSDEENLVAACGRCNRSKSDKTPSEWRQ